MNGIHDLGGMLVVAAGEIVGRSHPLGGGPRGPRRVLRAPDRMSVKQIQISEPRRARPPPPGLRFGMGEGKTLILPQRIALSPYPTTVTYKRHWVRSPLTPPDREMP